MSKRTEKLEETVCFVAGKLKGKQYAFRGTASLVLQGIDMNVDDIDIVCDKDTALSANKSFSEHVKDKVVFSEADKYKSYLGSFVINNVDVEIYGDWQIKNKDGQWSEMYSASDDQRVAIEIDGIEVFVTKIETELEMFAAMGRWSAYHKIKKQLASRKQPVLFK